jgi:putative nucleotidyltransferase with HDIG domain
METTDMNCVPEQKTARGIRFSNVRRNLDLRGRHDLPAAARAKKSVILVVDDETACGQVLSARLKLAGFRSSFVVSCDEAMKALETNHVDAILCDLRMPGFGGLELLRRIRKNYPWLAFLLLTSLGDANIGAQAIKDGADDYLIKPVQVTDVLRNLRRALERKRVEREALDSQRRLETLVFERTAQLRSALRSAEESYENTLLALGTALDLRDGQTGGHSRRVCRYSLEIANRMCCSEAQLETLRRGALLHDIGKLAVPDAILLKTGRLDPEEWNVMRRHVEIGYNLLRRIPFLEDAAELVLCHHERYDGSGYPRELRGEQIPLNARIFALADALDAMTTPRPYQPTRPILQAIDELSAQAGRHFDPQVIQAFLGISAETLQAIHMEAPDRPRETVSDRPTEWEPADSIVTYG